MDDAVGQILDSLKELGLRSKTLILFTSDNGPSLQRQERGGCAGLFRCGKGTTYEGGVRVPFFMHWGGFVHPWTSHTLITSLDIYPTLMSMISYQSKNSTDGFDFSHHILKRDAKFNPRESFLYFPGHVDQTIGPYAVRYKNYKAHFYTEGNELSDGNNYDFACTTKANRTLHNPPLLFDLNLDPGERYPLDPNKNRDLLLEIQYVTMNIMKTMTWADGEMKKPNSNSAQPCAQKGCRDFPSCCSTKTKLPLISIIHK
uniref:Sulfatase N-terminal domain-containing protein n=1 Tax=Lepeophtheirus salmonis TaxID=72036 RepID=A0A0K2VEM6_LEPSM